MLYKVGIKLFEEADSLVWDWGDANEVLTTKKAYEAIILSMCSTILNGGCENMGEEHSAKV